MQQILKQTGEIHRHLMSGSNFAAANLVPLCIEPSESASAEDSVAYIIRRINGARNSK